MNGCTKFSFLKVKSSYLEKNVIMSIARENSVKFGELRLERKTYPKKNQKKKKNICEVLKWNVYIKWVIKCLKIFIYLLTTLYLS